MRDALPYSIMRLLTPLDASDLCGDCAGVRTASRGSARLDPTQLDLEVGVQRLVTASRDPAVPIPHFSICMLESQCAHAAVVAPLSA